MLNGAGTAAPSATPEPRAASSPFGRGLGAEPLHAQIREDLRRMIVQHRWPAHHRLPSEAQLMQRYGVSRITVRQALQALVEAGLVVKVSGRGSFVAGPRPVQQLTRLQGLAEALSPQGYTLVNRIVTLERVPADALVAERLALPRGSLVTHLRRVRLVDGVPVCTDRSWLPLDIGDQVAMADLQHRDVFAVIEQEAATPLGHASMMLHAMAAPGDVAERLGVAPGAAVMVGDRITHDRHGRPVDYEQLYWRGDNFRFQLAIEREAGEHGRGAAAVAGVARALTA